LHKSFDLKNIISKLKSNEKYIKDNSYCLSSLKYRFCNYLNFNDLLLDGFFDIGSTSSLFSNSNSSININDFILKNTITVKNQTKYQIREVILIDKKKDNNLDIILNECMLLERNNLIYEKIISKILSLMDNDCNDTDFNKFMLYYFNKNKKNIINIGDIRNGLDRHKSLLFKYLCDNIGLNCSIFRENKINQDGFIFEDHIWNLIQIDNIKLIVDFRYNNGKIIEPIDDFTKSYYKTNSI